MKDTNSKVISIRFSEEEHQILQQKSQENQMNISQYIKERLFQDNLISDENSFEYKTTKTINVIHALVAVMAKDTLTDERHNLAVSEAKRLIKKNGIKLEDDQ